MTFMPLRRRVKVLKRKLALVLSPLKMSSLTFLNS